MKGKIHIGRDLMPTADQVIEIMTGPSDKGPKRCVICHKGSTLEKYGFALPLPPIRCMGRTQ